MCHQKQAAYCELDIFIKVTGKRLERMRSNVPSLQITWTLSLPLSLSDGKTYNRDKIIEQGQVSLLTQRDGCILRPM